VSDDVKDYSDLEPHPTIDELRMTNVELEEAMRSKSVAELRRLAKPFREWSDDYSVERAHRVLRRHYAQQELRAREAT